MALARVDEARINPITDRELETTVALTGLKVISLNKERCMFIIMERLKNLKVKEELDNFLTEHDELMNEFHYWLVDAKA